MPNFKPKAKKKIKVTKNATVTVDNKHQEKMDEFKNLEENVIPSLKIKEKELKRKLKYEDLNLEEQLESKDELKKIKKQIKNHEQKKKKYLLDNSKYVFEYYENKKGLAIDNNSKTKVLHSFFKKNKNNHDEKNTRKLINNSQKYLTNIDESFLNINDYIQSHEVCSNCSGELIPVESEV